MKKNIINVGLIGVMCLLSVQAMEVEQELLLRQPPSINSTYESLTESVLHDIHEQQDELHVSYNDIASFSVENMRQKFPAMSNDDQHSVIKKMSPNVLLLLCVATYLPSDLVKQICVLMMDGEMSSNFTIEVVDKMREKIGFAAKEFYTMPIGQAFDRYHSIKEWINKGQPIGPLFVATQKERDLLLGVQPAWNSPIPVIFSYEKELVDELGDLKNLYLGGQEVNIFEIWDNSTIGDWCPAMAAVSCGPCFFGSSALVATAIGACYGNVKLCLCSQPFLILFGTASSACCLCGTCVCLGIIKTHIANYKRMTF